jgi:hypothetical protein
VKDASLNRRGRAIVCGSNIHRLREIRDAADNMPAANAIKELEQISDEQLNKSAVSDSPHVTIRIVNVASSAPSNKPHEIEHEETRITSDVFSDAIDKKAYNVSKRFELDQRTGPGN